MTANHSMGGLNDVGSRIRQRAQNSALLVTASEGPAPDRPLVQTRYPYPHELCSPEEPPHLQEGSRPAGS
jgi:hypothetical protein